MKRIIFCLFIIVIATELQAQDDDRKPIITLMTTPLSALNPDGNVQISAEKWLPDTKWSVMLNGGYIYDYLYMKSLFKGGLQFNNLEAKVNGVLVSAEAKYHFDKNFYLGPYLFTKYSNLRFVQTNSSSPVSELLTKNVYAFGGMIGFNTNVSQGVALNINSGIGIRHRTWRINGGYINVKQSISADPDDTLLFFQPTLIDFFFSMKLGINIFKD